MTLCRKSFRWRGCESIGAPGPPGHDWLTVPSQVPMQEISFCLRQRSGNLFIKLTVRSESYSSVSSHYTIRDSFLLGRTPREYFAGAGVGWMGVQEGASRASVVHFHGHVYACIGFYCSSGFRDLRLRFFPGSLAFNG